MTCSATAPTGTGPGTATATRASRSRSWAEHRGITAAIETGDPHRAGRLVRAHIARARDGFLPVLQDT